MFIELKAPRSGEVRGTFRVVASKSESNRLLMIRAVSGLSFDITNLSAAADTVILKRILDAAVAQPAGGCYDAGAGGTTFRFLTAYFASRKGRVLLTCSDRMKERPVSELVNALRSLGATINYKENEGNPPLAITGRTLKGGNLIINAGISSQFLSALMLIAPALESGLRLNFGGHVVSRSYLCLTARLMQRFGVNAQVNANQVIIPSGNYSLGMETKQISVNGDWSAVSYFYALAAVSKYADITVKGIQTESGQADEVCAFIFQFFGVDTIIGPNEIRLIKNNLPEISALEFNCVDCPDIAQTIAVVCAAKKIPAKLSGLSTLRDKETDRIHALQTELLKFNVQTFVDDDVLTLLPESADFSACEAVVQTYQDHRMAMSFAPLVLMTKKIKIADLEVVKKSFPAFWDALIAVGIQCNIQ